MVELRRCVVAANAIRKAAAAIIESAAHLSSQSTKESIGSFKWQLKVIVIVER